VKASLRRASAERGHGRAQLMRGRYLIDSVAGKHDFAKGRLWLEQAAAVGISELIRESVSKNQ
jgi:uncharacterized protein